MSAHDRIGAWEVAHDLLELGREPEAKALLDAELPTRHAIPCAACGQPMGQPCRERALRTCRFCNGTKERLTVTFADPDPQTHYRPEPRREMLPCNECGGRGEREIDVDRVLPHQSRILKIERRW